MRKSIHSFLIVICSLILFACTQTEASLVTIGPENPTIHDQVLVTINQEHYFQEDIVKVEIHAEELGVPSLMVMDEALHQLTIPIDDEVELGEHAIQIVITYADETTEMITETIQVVEADQDGNLDFTWEEAVIYFALTDRFYNGDSTNDYLVHDLEHRETYHGGDFQGLIEKMPYLQELGVNTLWITPIVDNIEWNVREPQGDAQYGYHGYWAKDFTQIDEHLGEIETFQTLLETAHDHGIKVMVDVVLNHAGYGMKTIDTNPGVENFPTQDEQTTFEEMLRLEPVPNHQVVGELSGLPDFITEDPEVRQQLIEWQTDWIEKTRTERGDTIDFFRVDTIKHVEDTTWKAFKNRLIELQPDFKLLGEHYGGSIQNTGGYFHDGEMDAILDFDFKNIAGRFVNWDIIGVQNDLIDRNEKMSSDATMAQFLSSHDEDGFLYRQAGGDLGKHMVAAALQLTAKGIPVIYYGEEIGQTGPTAKSMDHGEYSENRYDFDWDAIDSTGMAMHRHYQKLLGIRKGYSEVFAKGDRQTVAGTNQEGYLFFTRTYEDESVLVGLNTWDEEQRGEVTVSFSPGSVLIDLYSGEEYAVSQDRTISWKLPSRTEGGTIILVEKE